MISMNKIIANNIVELLNRQNKRKIDFAQGINLPKQTVSRMLNGSQTFSATELKKISEYLCVSMDELLKIPEVLPADNIVYTFMGDVKTDEARKAVKFANEISELILFHKRVRNNASKMPRRIDNG